MVAQNQIQMPRAVAEMCERLAGSIIEKKSDIQSNMLKYELERMDVIAAGVTGAMKVWQKFDAARGNQPQTFLHRPIENGMRDFIRRERSQQERRDGLAWEMGGGRKPEKVDKKAVKNAELADWLRGAFNAAKRLTIPGRFKQGRRRHEPPQLVAIAHLVNHEGLTFRGCARLLANREDLRGILGLKHLPSYNAIWKAMKLAENVVTETPDKPAEVVTEKGRIDRDVVTGTE